MHLTLRLVTCCAVLVLLGSGCSDKAEEVAPAVPEEVVQPDAVPLESGSVPAPSDLDATVPPPVEAAAPQVVEPSAPAVVPPGAEVTSDAGSEASARTPDSVKQQRSGDGRGDVLRYLPDGASRVVWGNAKEMEQLVQRTSLPGKSRSLLAKLPRDATLIPDVDNFARAVYEGPISSGGVRGKKPVLQAAGTVDDFLLRGNVTTKSADEATQAALLPGEDVRIPDADTAVGRVSVTVLQRIGQPFGGQALLEAMQQLAGGRGKAVVPAPRGGEQAGVLPRMGEYRSDDLWIDAYEPEPGVGVLVAGSPAAVGAFSLIGKQGGSLSTLLSGLSGAVNSYSADVSGDDTTCAEVAEAVGGTTGGIGSSLLLKAGALVGTMQGLGNGSAVEGTLFDSALDSDSKIDQGLATAVNCTGAVADAEPAQKPVLKAPVGVSNPFK